MSEANPDAAFRAFAAERRYGAATLERWARLAPPDAAALGELVHELRLGENQLRDLWEWLDEIAARDGETLAAVLASDPVRTARQRHLSRNDRLKLIKGVLRKRRFPQLAAHEERLAALVHELNLPRAVRVTLPEFLEGDALHLEIVADSIDALRAAAEALRAAAHTSACAELFTLLGEAP